MESQAHTVHSFIETHALIRQITQTILAIGGVCATLCEGCCRHSCQQEATQKSIHIWFFFLSKFISACKIIEKFREKRFLVKNIE
jgi:hypothetical protein